MSMKAAARMPPPANPGVGNNDASANPHTPSDTDSDTALGAAVDVSSDAAFDADGEAGFGTILSTAPPACSLLAQARDRSSAPERLAVLLLAVGQRDEVAFEELYRSCNQRVHGLVRRVLLNEEMSAETTQEVFLALWQGGPSRFDPGKGSALTWILTIAHRKAVDKVRSEQSRLVRDICYGIKNQQPAYDTVAETVLNRLDAAKITRCLNVLSPLQDQAIRLAFYTGLTYTEIAQHIGIPVPTVKSRIRDGMRKIATCLREQRPSP
ncbi:sigma-70 family RNA polymerase sigma factor [Arthrobacter cheniae]|uniref:Sigma-70 family RNA polymerase sigma factor n=1 Tax=Arthrobacter cheniae TaxID=1258888 RepID=A0A3A5M987_9MICC|nr:sigma-70 family RNA polymerase sigma factor [Arthrobacter cheniae]RJT74885.1 sigma-70 family RNA polymerase sigma factor [Arthrobacter cheniae]